MKLLATNLFVCGTSSGIIGGSFFHCPCYFNSLIKFTGKRLKTSHCKRSTNNSFESVKNITETKDNFSEEIKAAKEVELIGYTVTSVGKYLDKLFQNRKKNYECIVSYGNNKKYVDCDINSVYYWKEMIPFWLVKSNDKKYNETINHGGDFIEYSFYKIKIKASDFPDSINKDFSNVTLVPKDEKNNEAVEFNIFSKLVDSNLVNGSGRFFIAKYNGENMNLSSFKCKKIQSGRQLTNCKIVSLNNKTEKNPEQLTIRNLPGLRFTNKFRKPIQSGWFGIKFDEEIQYSNLKDEKIVLVHDSNKDKTAELTNISAYYAITSQSTGRNVALIG